MAKQPKIGGKIVLDGEKEYKNAITNINSSMKVLQSEMKKVTSEFGNNQGSVQAITAKNEVLNKQYETQKQKVQTLQDALKNAVNNQEKIRQSTEQYKNALEDAEKEMEHMKDSSESSTEELEEQQKKIDELKNAVQKSENAYQSNERNINKWQTSLNGAEAELNNLENSIKDNTEVIKKMQDANVDNIEELKKMEQQVDNTTDSTNTFGDVLKANIAGEAIIEGVKMLTSAITDMTKAVIGVGADFEASMSQVSAVSGATGSDFEKLNDKAKEMGATTKFTAAEAADAFNYMAMAGWKTEDMLGGIDGILSLAAAGATELATTSDIVTDALTAFGESAEEAGRLADIMAAASSNANTNVEMMGETFKYAAPVAGALGYSMEDTAVAIGLMANSGIKASQAGTSLRGVLNRMAAPPKTAAAAMTALELSITKQDGSMKSLSEVMEELRAKFSDLSESEKVLRASQLAGQNAMSGLLAIVNAAPADFEKLTKAVENSNGAAKEMSEIMQDNLKGDIDELESATEGLGIAVYDKFGNVFRKSVSEVTNEVSKLTRQMETGSLGDKMEELAEGVGDVAESALNLAIDIIPVLINGFNFIVSNGAEITSVLEGIATAMMIQKAAAVYQTVITSLKQMQTALTSVTAAQETANAAANANPYVLLASVIAGATVALGRYAIKTAKANRENDEMYQKVKENKEAISELQNTIDSNNNAYNDSIANIKANADVLSEMKDELYKLNEKEEKTVVEKTKMNAIVEKLNESMPDLNLAIDEQTGKLNLNKQAITDNIAAMKKEAEERAMQERYVQKIDEQVSTKEQQAKAEVNLADAAAQYNNLLAEQQKLQDKIKNTSLADRFSDEYNDMISQMKQNKSTLEKYKVNMQDAQEAVDAATKAVNSANEEFENFDSIMQEMSMDNVVESTECTSEKTVQLTQKLAELQEEYDKTFTEAQESITGQINLFDEFGKGTKASIEEMQKNLESNIKGMQDWRKNLTKLSKTCSEDFVSYLESMGIGASAEVEALANATPEQLKKYENAWKTSQNEINKTVKYSCKDIKEETNKTTKELEKSIKDDKKAQKAIKDSMNNIVATGKQEAKKSKEIGSEISSGIAQGIRAGFSTIAKAGETAAATALKAAKDKLEIKSPSRKMKREVGIPTVQGIEAGIDAELPTLQRKMRYAVNVTIPNKQNSAQSYQGITRQQSFSNTQLQELIVNTVKAIDIPNTVVKAINNSGIKITYKDEAIGNIVAEQFTKGVRK